MAFGTAATVANIPQILKTLWKDDLTVEYYNEAPLLAMIPKRKDWTGLDLVIPIQIGMSGGRSTQFAVAYTNTVQSNVTKMQLQTADNFAVWGVDHKLMTLSKNDKGAVVAALENETKSAIRKFKRSTCWMLYGNGGGAVGRGDGTAANITTTVFKLANAVSVRNFDIGDRVVFSATDGTTGAIRGNNISLTVMGVDPEGQAITLSAAPNTLTGGTAVAANDYVFPEGDFGTTMKGLETYVTPTSPTTALWGMTRTTQPRRLGGIRVGGKGLLIQEAVKKALKVCADEGASVSHIFMSTTDYMNLELALGTQKRYVDETVGGVGFVGLEFTSGSKKVKVFADADCPVNVIWLLQMDTWTLHSAGDYPDFLMLGSDKYMVLQDANTIQGRVGGYAQLYTVAPGFNCRLDLTAA